jgi:hypothetical protein
VDKVDLAPFPGRSTDEPLLESTHPAGIFMCADIGRVESVAHVISDFGCSISDLRN